MNTLIRNTLKLKSASNVYKILSSQQKYFSKNSQNLKEAETVNKNPDDSIKFMGSGAQTLKTRSTRVGTFDPEDTPWFQTYAVLGSVAIFLIYFCILREENDIDAHLGKSIFEQIPSLEVSTLISLYKYNAENNIDNTDVIKRLLELGIDPRNIQ